MLSELKKWLELQIIACDNELVLAAAKQSIEQIRYIAGKRFGFVHSLAMLAELKETGREVELDA